MKKLQVKKLTGLFDTAIGLIGVKKPYAIHFQTNFGIHTFFMKFAIDVLILDQEHRVVRLKESLLPNRVFFWPIQFDHVIELPEGTIKKNKIVLGDRISF